MIAWRRTRYPLKVWVHMQNIKKKRAFLLLCVSNKESPRKAPEEFHHKEAKWQFYTTATAHMNALELIIFIQVCVCMFFIRSYAQWYCFSLGNCLSWCEDKWWRRSCCNQRRPVQCKRTCRKEWGMAKNTTCNVWDWHVTRDHCMLKVLVEKIAPELCETLKWAKDIHILSKHTSCIFQLPC